MKNPASLTGIMIIRYVVFFLGHPVFSIDAISNDRER